MSESVSSIDWKEVGITAGVTLVTAIIGCTIAVVFTHTVILPAMAKSKAKKDDKEKDAAKK